MPRIEVNGYYAFGIPAYLLLIAIEIALTRRKGLKVYKFADTISNFSGGLGEIVIGLFLGPYLLTLYDFGLKHIRLIEWPEASIWPWILAPILADLCYYWYHRAGHRIGAFWAIHGVHHQTEEFNISVATRHPWFSDSYSFLFYIPLPMLGIPSAPFFVGVAIISFYALTVHSRTFHRPSFYVFVTPKSHIVHHSKNPKYLGQNLGAMLTIWDRLFGTHVDLDEPAIVGSKTGYETHDGARAQWIYWQDLFHVAKQAKDWRDKLRVFITYPGWRPSDVEDRKRERARSDDEISLGIKIYVVLQFSITLFYSTYILWSRDNHSTAMLIASTLLILASLSTIGRILDGRRYAAITEATRVFVTLIVAGFFLWT